MLSVNWVNCVGCDDYLKLKSTEDCVLTVFILRSNLYFPICLFVAPLSDSPGWQHSAWPPLSATFSKLIRLNYSAINSGYSVSVSQMPHVWLLFAGVWPLTALLTVCSSPQYFCQVSQAWGVRWGLMTASANHILAIRRIITQHRAFDTIVNQHQRV